MAKPTFRTAPEAAHASNWNKAIGSSKKIRTPRGEYNVCIVYERGRYFYVYAGAISHVLPDTVARPSSADIDGERSWRPW